MRLDVCDNVDSVIFFRIIKKDFAHQNNEDYFSYADKGFSTDIFFTCWFFNSNEKAKECFKYNKEAFYDNPTPIRTFILSSILITIRPSSQKETDLYHEVINILKSIPSILLMDKKSNDV
jgi:hypothetical protein